jgi:hypothetical protein
MPLVLAIHPDGSADQAGGLVLDRALRARCGVPVLALVMARGNDGSRGRPAGAGCRVTPLPPDGRFGFVVDGPIDDLPDLALDIICPESPLLVVVGMVHRRPRPPVEAMILVLRCADLGLPVLMLEQDVAADPARRADDLADRGAAIAAACLGLRQLRGSVLRVRFPAGADSAAGPMRFAALPPDVLPHHRLVRPANGEPGWHRLPIADGDDVVAEDGRPGPVASIIPLARPDEAADLAILLADRCQTPGG